LMNLRILFLKKKLISYMDVVNQYASFKKKSD